MRASCWGSMLPPVSMSTTLLPASSATVPKLIDVLTPAGVLQSDELDYTIHSPVTLQGVAIP